VENQKQVFHFRTAPIPFSQKQGKPRRAAGLSPAHARTPAALARRLQKPKKGAISQPPISGSSRIGMKLLFQARLALESILVFRLISGLENAQLNGAPAPHAEQSLEYGTVDDRHLHDGEFLTNLRKV
jgi:hypothetical protein